MQEVLVLSFLIIAFTIWEVHLGVGLVVMVGVLWIGTGMSHKPSGVFLVPERMQALSL